MATLQITGHGTRKLKPLSTSLSFRFEGGAPVQAVNAVTGEHVPDWRFSPIRIVPVITVTDPEGLVTNGVHNSDTPAANMRWLYDESGANVLQGVSPADMSMDTGASDLRGALNIRRNFDAGALLRFEYEFTTSVGGVMRTAKHSATVAVVVNQMADALVQVRTTYPRGQYVYFPSPTAPPDLAMDMRLYHNGKPCPTAYRWYAVSKDGQEAILPGQDGPILMRPANTVQNIDHYRCKALDMRPEYAAALEAAQGQARADVYKKYLGDNWEEVLPTCSDNIFPAPFYFNGSDWPANSLCQDLGQDPNRPTGYHIYRYANISSGSSSFWRWMSAELVTGFVGKRITMSFSARNRAGNNMSVRPHFYLKKHDQWDGSIYETGEFTELNHDGFTRCRAYIDVPQDWPYYGDHALVAGITFQPGDRDVEVKDVSLQINGSDKFLPTPALLQKEIAARAEEIVAAQTLTPPTDWPLSRTYTRDFSLRVHTVPYELVLDVEGLGERTIVRNGSLAVGSGAGQELFSNVPRSMTQLRSRILCRQGGHTYSVEETARMFDVRWPGSATNVDGCSATMNDLQFALSITPKY